MVNKAVCSFLILFLISSNCYAIKVSNVSLRNNILFIKEKSNVMPLGDSITLGEQDTPLVFGYRDHLQDHLGIGSYDFVGTQKSPASNATYDVDHAGVSGETTASIEARVSTNLSNYFKSNGTGDIVLIHAGTNDSRLALSQTDAVANVEDMIDLINAYNSNISVYVAKIIRTKDDPTRDTWTDTYNGLLETMLQTYQGSKSNLHIVDMDAKFSENVNWKTDYMADTGHPNDTGYGLMADQWYACIINASATNCNGN